MKVTGGLANQNYQSMAERRKQDEALRSTPVTPTRVTKLTPVQIPGKSTPRRATPSRASGLRTPDNKPAGSVGTPSFSSPPLKGSMETPDRSKYSGQKESKKKKKKRKSQDC